MSKTEFRRLQKHVEAAKSLVQESLRNLENAFSLLETTDQALRKARNNSSN